MREWGRQTGDMDSIETGTEKREERREGRRFSAEPVFFMAGVFGLLLFLYSLAGARMNVPAVFSLAVLLGGALWLSWNRRKGIFYLLLFILLPAGALYVYLLRDTLRLQFGGLLDRLASGTGGEAADITLTALLIAAVLTVVLFLLECVMEKHGICLLLTVLPLLALPMLSVREEDAVSSAGMRAARLACYPLLLLFQISFQVIRHTGRGRESRSLTGIGRLRLSEKGCAAAAGLFGMAVLAASFPVLLNQDVLYELVYDAEGYVTRTFRNVTGLAQEANADGRISRGNNYRTGTVQLILQTDAQPTEMLYLKGFEGGEYTGGSWNRANDEALFERMAERLDWGEWSYMISGMYYSMYYAMNEGVYAEDAVFPRYLGITHAGGSYYNTYTPYYSQRGAGLLFQADGEEGYAFRYFEQQDMHIGEGRVPESFSVLMGWYREIQDAYEEEAQTVYTRVPEELLPRLTALVEENPVESLEEITAFILYTLQSNTSYTLTPGHAPVNEEVMEYFLFEGKRGYCVHYAAAATLMYRLYGIPARYASGYAVPPPAFRQTAEGSWRAEVTDEQAHAWVEIFLEDYGWTPVEVTPSESGMISASCPGFAPEQMDRLLAERGWNPDVPGLSGISAQRSGEPGTEEAGTPEKEALRRQISSFLQERRELWAAAAACAVYTLLLFPLFLDYRRLRVRRRMEKEGCRQVFDRLLQMLHFCGYMTGYDGTQEDFPEKLAASCALSHADAARLRQIVERAAYGAGGPEEAEEDFVRKIYLRAAEHLYQELSRTQRLVFRYIKAFG